MFLSQVERKGKKSGVNVSIPSANVSDSSENFV